LPSAYAGGVFLFIALNWMRVHSSREKFGGLSLDQGFVGRISLQGREELLDLVGGFHVEQATAEGVDGFYFFGEHQEVFLAGSRGGEVDGGEEPKFGDGAIEDQFHVARAFEFLENDLVGPGSGVHEAGGDDGERAAFFRSTGRPEKLFGNVEGLGVQPAGHGAAAFGIF